MAADAASQRVRPSEPSVDLILAALIGSNVLETLEITQEDLVRARRDADLLETLTITYELLVAFEEAGVLDTFFRLPRGDQANFLRWIGSTDDLGTRATRTTTFVSALQAAPLPRPEPSQERSSG